MRFFTTIRVLYAMPDNNQWTCKLQMLQSNVYIIVSSML